MLLKIQMVINTSLAPIRIVKMFAEGLSRCKILPTISSCLGTRFSTLQKSPFTSQTVAMSMLRILFVRLLFITCKVCVALAQRHVSCSAFCCYYIQFRFLSFALYVVVRVEQGNRCIHKHQFFQVR